MATYTVAPGAGEVDFFDFSFNFLFQGTVAYEYTPNANIQIDGVVYKDVYTHISAFYRTTLYGENITIDANGNLTGGTLSGFIEYRRNPLGTGNDVGAFSEIRRGFSLSGISVSDIIGVVGTPEIDDDVALYSTAFAGNDLIQLSGFADRFSGFSGNDTLYGHAGNDTLAGGSGDDIVEGGAGSDSIDGGEGSDTLTGGAGDDVLQGGAGLDTAVYSGSRTDYTIARNAGDGTVTVTDLRGLEGTDTLAGIERIQFGTGEPLVLANDVALPTATITYLRPTDLLQATADSFSATTNVELLSDQEIKLQALGSSYYMILRGSGFAFDAQLDRFSAGSITSIEIYNLGVQNASVVGLQTPADELYQAIRNPALTNPVYDGYQYINVGSSSDDVFFGGDGSANETIIGNEGLDTLSYLFAENGGVSANLELGIALKPGGGIDEVYTVENLTGSAQDDHLTGNSGNNWIEGLSGVDTIYGGGGDDTLSGDQGADTLTGGAGNDTLFGGDGNDMLWGEAEQDLLYGGAGNDSLFGGDGRDTLIGGDGNDVIDSSQGSAQSQGYGDVVNPGLGANTVIGHAEAYGIFLGGLTLSYQDVGAVGGVTVQVNADGSGTVTSGNAALINDTFTFVDDFIGTAENDQFFGGLAEEESFSGGSGADTIYGGSAEDPFTDYAAYFSESGGQGIVADLEANQITDTYGFVDTVANIEGVDGSYYSDLIKGSSGRNALFGAQGSDTIYGFDGTDYLDGGEGNDQQFGGVDDDILSGLAGADILDGGLGRDEVRYDRDARKGGANGVTVNLAEGWAIDGFGDTDTLISIERVRGTDFADWIVGSNFNDDLVTGAGNDTVAAGAGDDWIDIWDASSVGSKQIDGGAGWDGVGYGDGLLDAFRPSVAYGTPTSSLNFVDGSGLVRLTVTVMQDGVVEVMRLAGDGTVLGIDLLTSVEQVWMHAAILNGVQDRVRIDIDANAGTLTAFRYPRVELIGTDGDDVIVVAAELMARGMSLDDPGLEVQVFSLGGNDLIDLSGVSVQTYVQAEAGDDTLIGGEGQDFLYGGSGNDSLIGDSGRDILSGGDGDDLIDASTGTVESQSYGDGIIGSLGSDTILGHVGAYETVWAGGLDLTYENVSATGGITVTFDSYASGTVVSGTPGLISDTFTAVDFVIGTSEADTFFGGDGAFLAEMVFVGGAGNDFISGGGVSDLDRDLAGYLQGGGTQGISANLVTGQVVDTYGHTDTLVNIEGIEGSDFADQVTGNELDNFFFGHRGDDNLIGAGGRDTIYGGDGNDLITGGDGDDWIVSVADWIPILSGSSDTINGGAGFDGVGYDLVSLDTFRPSVTYNTAATELVFTNSMGSQAFVVRMLAGAAVEVTHFAADGSVSGVDQVSEVEQIWVTLPWRNGIQDRVRIDIDAVAGTLTAVRAPRVNISGTDASENILIADRLISAVLQPETLDVEIVADGLGGNDTVDGTGIHAQQFLSGGAGNDLLIGGSGGDELLGGVGNDSLFGGAGDDWIYFEAGNDVYDGGAGFDRADYRDAPGAVHVNLETGLVSDGGGGLDTLLNVERVTGSAFNDVLIGNSSEINSFSGELGDDTILGGDGWDYVWYGRAAGAVFVDLALGVATGAEGNDSLSSVEGLGGSNYSDTLLGNDADNWIELDMEGDQYTPNYSVGGNDYVDGRGGFDAVIYWRAISGIQVDLAAGTAIDGLGNTDTLIAIERIDGSDFADVISGSSVAESLSGRDGRDTIFGGDGQDSLFGGSGGDFLDGGAGDDILDDGFGYDTIDGGAGTDTLLRRYSPANPYDDTLVLDLVKGTVTSLADPNEQPDILINMENLRVSGELTFILVGDAGANLLETDAGNDSLYGGAGNDSLYGGIGNDSLIYGSGDDVIYGGDGDDIIDDIVGTQLPGLTLIYAGAGNDSVWSGEGDDTVYGGSGDDFLSGDRGNDTLDGGEGIDRLIGDEGDDVYFVDHALDWVDESPFSIDTGGYDKVYASVDFTLGAYAEELTLTGAGALSGTGNDLSNVIVGNEYGNTLVGKSGNDTLSGGLGEDTAGFSGNRSDYRILFDDVSGTYTVSDRRLAQDGRDTLTGIEHLAFGDGTVAVSTITLDDGPIDGTATGDLVVSGTPAEGGLLSASVNNFVDPDGYATLSYRWQELVGAAWVDLAGGAQASLAIPDDQSFVGKSVRVIATSTDHYGGVTEFVGSATVIQNVNDAPIVAAAVNLGSTLEDTVRTITAADLLAGAVDADGDRLSISGLSASSGTLFSEGGNGGASTDTNLDLTWTWTPDANDTTAVTFTYSVTDGTASVTQTATLDLTPVNDAPIVAAAVNLGSTPEDTARTITASALLAGATDADGDVLSVANLQASSGSLVNNNNGTWTWTPALNDTTGVTFTYNITDGTASVAQTATLDLTPVNDTPTGTVVIQGSALQGQTLTANTTAIADADGLGSFSFIWYRNGAAITGATAATYLLTAGDVNAAITVRASYTDGFNTAETLLSAATVPVTSGSTPGVTRTGTARADTLNGTGGDDVLSGLAGNDVLTGLGGNDRLLGGDGNDTLSGGLGGDTLDGGAGTDTATYADATTGVTVSLAVTTAHETGVGADQLIGIENLIGGNGNDTLSGNAGANNISGGGGDDRIMGGAGNDTLTGGTNGAAGDTVSYADATTGVTVSLAITAAQNTGISTGSDVLSGFENLEGSAFADQLTGSTGNNVIRGGAGADRITGGDGTDFLYGGADADTFVFAASSNSRVGIARDVIFDWEIGDVLDFSAIDANTLTRGNQAFTFMGASAFTAAGQLRMYEANGVLLVEGNTGGTIDPEFQLELRQWNSSTFSDILL